MGHALTVQRGGFKVNCEELFSILIKYVYVVRQHSDQIVMKHYETITVGQIKTEQI